MNTSVIDFFSITDLQDKHDQFLILNRIDDPVAAFPDTVEVALSGEFLDTRGTRIALQSFQACEDSFLSRFGQRFELTFCWRGEKDGVGHGSSEAEILENCIKRLRTFLSGFGERCSGIGEIDPIFQFFQET